MSERMNERVVILREAVVKITQMLSGKGIRVTQRGVSAYVKSDHMGRPILVNLPYLPDNATDELCLAIQGFLDHEVAHILFTNFEVSLAAGKEGNHSYFNLLEDTRIEREMAKRFQGCGHNLAVTGDFFLRKYSEPAMKEAAEKGDANAVIGVLFIPLIRAMSGQHVFKEYMKSKMHIVQAVYDKIADLAPAIEGLKSSEDCLNMAREIKKRLEGEGEPSGPGGEGEGEGEPGGSAVSKLGKKSKPGEGKPKKADKAKKSGKADKEDEGEAAAGTPGEEEKPGEGAPTPSAAGEEGEEEGTPAPGAGAPGGEDEGDGGSAGDGEGEEEGEAGGSSDDGGDGSGDSSGEPPKSSPEEVTMKLGVGKAIMSAIDKENANGFDEKMSVVISNDAAASAKVADYLVYTKEQDTVEPLKIGRGYVPSMFSSMADKVDHMVGPLQKDLERAVAARSLATWESGRRSGRISPANLSRLAVGDPRVFRKRHETTSKDVAVSLVVDCSGSMGGEKIHLATQSAYALSSVLERIGIQHEVICFTTGEPVADSATLNAEERKIGRSFSRVESLFMPVLKGFNERIRADVRERFGWLPNGNFLRNNVDGECIEVAARRLMSRREEGKVMIVLSDGAPNAHGHSSELSEHLAEMVKKVTASGIKVVGIGIKSDAVRNYYPKNVVIHDVAELPTRVIKELRHALI